LNYCQNANINLQKTCEYLVDCFCTYANVIRICFSSPFLLTCNTVMHSILYGFQNVNKAYDLSMSYMCPAPEINETNLYYSRKSDIEVWLPQYIQTRDTFRVIALFAITFHVQKTQNLYNCFSHWKMNETRWMFLDLCPSCDVTHTISSSYMNTPKKHNL